MRSAASHSQLDSSAFDRSDFAVAAGLAVIAAIVIFPGLGVQSLANWDEAIYGVVTRELLAHLGLALRYGDRPLVRETAFGILADGCKLFGLRSDRVCPAPAERALWNSCHRASVLGRAALGQPNGRLLAAVLLLGVPQFVAYSRMAMTDVPLATLGMLSVVLLLYANGRSSLIMAAGAAFGFAILTKSAAAFLFLPGLLAIVIAQHGLGFLRSREICSR